MGRSQLWQEIQLLTECVQNRWGERGEGLLLLWDESCRNQQTVRNALQGQKCCKKNNHWLRCKATFENISSFFGIKNIRQYIYFSKKVAYSQSHKTKFYAVSTKGTYEQFQLWRAW